MSVFCYMYSFEPCILLHDVQFTNFAFCYMMYLLFTNVEHCICYMYSLQTFVICAVYELYIFTCCTVYELYVLLHDVQFTNFVFCYMYSLQTFVTCIPSVRTCVTCTVYELYVLLHNVQFTITMFYNLSKFDRLKIVGLYIRADCIISSILSL